MTESSKSGKMPGKKILKNEKTQTQPKAEPRTRKKQLFLPQKTTHPSSKFEDHPIPDRFQTIPRKLEWAA